MEIHQGEKARSKFCENGLLYWFLMAHMSNVVDNGNKWIAEVIWFSIFLYLRFQFILQVTIVHVAYEFFFSKDHKLQYIQKERFCYLLEATNYVNA